VAPTEMMRLATVTSPPCTASAANNATGRAQSALRADSSRAHAIYRSTQARTKLLERISCGTQSHLGICEEARLPARSLLLHEVVEVEHEPRMTHDATVARPRNVTGIIRKRDLHTRTAWGHSMHDTRSKRADHVWRDASERDCDAPESPCVYGR
jgi:hypothetical protein